MFRKFTMMFVIILSLTLALYACSNPKVEGEKEKAGNQEKAGLTDAGPMEKKADKEQNEIPEKKQIQDQKETPEEVEEFTTIGEVKSQPEIKLRCGGRIAKEWPFHNKVSNGKITVVEENGYKKATIDATAGGMQAARNNPFIYLDMDEGKKVEIDDFQSLRDHRWELAFKRVAIRSNSGDSGTGSVKVGKMEHTTFEAVKSVPKSLYFATDMTLNDQCRLLTDPINQPKTAFHYLNKYNPSGSGSWYNYQGGVSPMKGDIYIITGTDKGKTYKMEIMSWKHGVFVIRWQAL